MMEKDRACKGHQILFVGEGEMPVTLNPALPPLPSPEAREVLDCHTHGYPPALVLAACPLVRKVAVSGWVGLASRSSFGYTAYRVTNCRQSPDGIYIAKVYRRHPVGGGFRKIAVMTGREVMSVKAMAEAFCHKDYYTRLVARYNAANQVPQEAFGEIWTRIEATRVIAIAAWASSRSPGDRIQATRDTPGGDASVVQGGASQEPQATDPTRELTDQRGAIYGHPWDNHLRIARKVEGTLDVRCTPERACQIMLDVKNARLTQTPVHADTAADILGYTDRVLREIVALRRELEMAYLHGIPLSGLDEVEVIMGLIEKGIVSLTTPDDALDRLEKWYQERT